MTRPASKRDPPRPDPGSPYVVGLTGGIGSGKSEAARRFARLGAELIDADAISHRLTAVGAPGWLAVRGAFGPAYFLPDEALDRALLRRRVFADPALRARLEGVLHPIVGAEIERELAAWRGPYGILMVPLLLESGRYLERIDRLLVVDCPEELQLARVVERSGLDETEVRAIMASQVPRRERRAAADDLIDSSGSLEELEAQIERLDRQYRSAALGPRKPAARSKAVRQLNSR